MKKKGFTMIELIATMVILGIIMAIAVPTTIKTINRNKRKAFVQDGFRFYAIAKNYVNRDRLLTLPKYTDQSQSHATILSLLSMKDTDLQNSPYSIPYNYASSFVVIVPRNNNSKYENGKYDFYINLVACKGEPEKPCTSSSWELSMLNFDELNNPSVENLVKAGQSYKNYISYRNGELFINENELKKKLYEKTKISYFNTINTTRFYIK